MKLKFTAALFALMSLPTAAQDGAPQIHQGPAYQYEGKWMATLQSAAGTPIDTVASCASPIVLIADGPQSLRRADGVAIEVSQVDRTTLSWREDGRMTVVTPSMDGNFIALTHFDAAGRLDHGRIVNYLRCGTAGATAAQQVCVAE